MANPVRNARLSHALMFWLLSGMGVATAVPCFLVPPIDAYRTLLHAERRELETVRRLETLAARQTTLSEALRKDPQVNIRLAQRDLGYRAPGHVEPVGSPSRATALQEPGDAENQPLPQLPAWIAQVYPARFASVYRDERARHVVLFLSLGLILFALAAYGSRSRGSTPACGAERG